MKRKLKRKVKIVGEDNREITLKYYITESENSNNCFNQYGYGIEVVKVCEDEEEYKVIENLSYSQEYIFNLINKFANNSVTPITLLEIYNDEVK